MKEGLNTSSSKGARPGETSLEPVITGSRLLAPNVAVEDLDGWAPPGDELSDLPASGKELAERCLHRKSAADLSVPVEGVFGLEVEVASGWRSSVETPHSAIRSFIASAGRWPRRSTPGSALSCASTRTRSSVINCYSTAILPFLVGCPTERSTLTRHIVGVLTSNEGSAATISRPLWVQHQLLHLLPLTPASGQQLIFFGGDAQPLGK